MFWFSLWRHIKSVECTCLLSHISSDRYVIVCLYRTDLYLPSFRQYTNLIRLHVSSWRMLQITATVLHQYWYNKVIKSYQYKYRFFWNHTDYSILKESSKLYFRFSEWTPMSYQTCILFYRCIEIKVEKVFCHIIKLSFIFVCLTDFFQVSKKFQSIFRVP